MVYYKVYHKEAEKKERFPIFGERVKKIHEFNTIKNLWKAGLNPFTDETKEDP